MLLIVLLSFAAALPPFEIRSSGQRKSEGAEEWMTHLQRHKSCKHISVSERLDCPASGLLEDVQCITWKQLCDGRADCSTGEDEIPAMCYFLKQRAHQQNLDTKIKRSQYSNR